MIILRVLCIILEILPEHPSDTKVITMKMEILLEPTSNKLLVGSYKDGDGVSMFQQSQVHNRMLILDQHVLKVMKVQVKVSKLPQTLILASSSQSQMEDHTSDWLRAVPISGLGQTMNDKTYRCVLWTMLYHARVLLVSNIGITLFDRVLSFDTNWMADFVPGRAMIDAAQHKRGKYMAKCAAIGYGFLPFSFSSLGELEADAVALLKRIRKYSMAQDIRARGAIHIFNRISFAIAKGVGA
ncbi:hypothetical protein Tco_0189212 [Tanacetum coccineum]